MDKEVADALRGMVRIAVMKNVDDDGEMQTASVEVAEGVWRDKVEVMQPYGIGSHIPVDGAVAMVFAIGGDQGDLRAVPIANPAKRMGKLAEGEIGMYNEHGDKAVLTAGGNLDINTGAQVNITTAKSASITAEESVSITAKTCNVDGNIKCTGEVEDHTGTMQKMRDQYNDHGHPDASAPPGPLQD